MKLKWKRRKWYKVRVSIVKTKYSITTNNPGEHGAGDAMHNLSIIDATFLLLSHLAANSGFMSDPR